MCSLSSLSHVYVIELRITTVSVCHICLAHHCLRESLYTSGLISVLPSQVALPHRDQVGDDGQQRHEVQAWPHAALQLSIGMPVTRVAAVAVVAGRQVCCVVARNRMGGADRRQWH